MSNGFAFIHEAARRIAGTLAEMQIPFVVAGALAANAHGHVRTTEDVDILLTPQGLEEFKLPREFADGLNPYVRAKFAEMWEASRYQDDD